MSLVARTRFFIIACFFFASIGIYVLFGLQMSSGAGLMLLGSLCGLNAARLALRDHMYLDDEEWLLPAMWHMETPIRVYGYPVTVAELVSAAFASFAFAAMVVYFKYIVTALLIVWRAVGNYVTG